MEVFGNGGSYGHVIFDCDFLSTGSSDIELSYYHEAVNVLPAWRFGQTPFYSHLGHNKNSVLEYLLNSVYVNRHVSILMLTQMMIEL